MNTPKTQALYRHAKERIPGGVQLLSKRPENMAPGVWPPYGAAAHGCEVVDLDGNHYLDFSTNGIAACLLGYADPAVSEAVIKVIRDGSMCTLNPPEEVELADRLCDIHPWAERVRFARTGVVQAFECESAGEGAVAYERHHFLLAALDAGGFSEPEGGGYRSG